MQVLSIVNPDLIEIAKTEVKELTKKKATITSPLTLQCELTTEQTLLYLVHAQAPRRVCLLLGKTNDPESFQPIFDKALFQDRSFKFEVENLKGQPNRLEVARKLGKPFFAYLQDQKTSLEMKNPDLLIIVFHHQGTYYLGLDLTGSERNARQYRLFAHQASFKGDLAYHCIRESLFTPEHSLLVGFAKDATLAIEAALFAQRKPLHESTDLMFNTLFPGTKLPEVKQESGQIISFDQTTSNLNAARKNAHLADVQIKVAKYSLEELDVKFDQDFFDTIIFHLTRKDEDAINELYYQTKYLLKKGGHLLFISRPSFDPSISDTFTLVKNLTLSRGDSNHKLTLLKKK